jgi:aminopeptidase YwaD
MRWRREVKCRVMKRRRHPRTDAGPARLVNGGRYPRRGGTALCAAIVVLASLTASGGLGSGGRGIAPAAAAPALPETQAAIVGRVSGERAYQHVLELAQKIGSHPGGTPQDRTSGEYIAAHLTRDGCTVEWQPFTFPYFAVRRVALIIPDGPVLHPRVMEYSSSTAEQGLTGEVVDAGLGRPGDFGGQTAAGVALRGKIVLVRRGELTFRQKAENAADAGAAAIIVQDPAE